MRGNQRLQGIGAHEGASPGSTTAYFARPSARFAICIAWPVPFCGCCSTVSASSGSTTAATCSAWWPTTTTVWRAFSAHRIAQFVPRACAHRRDADLRRLDFNRVPLPAARITIAILLLDMVLSPFCGSSGYFATEGLFTTRRIVISGWGRRKGGQVGITCGADGFAGGDGPERGSAKRRLTSWVCRGVARLCGPRRAPEAASPPARGRQSDPVPCAVQTRPGIATARSSRRRPVRTMAFSREPPRMKAHGLSGSMSRWKQKVRARARR